MEKYQVISLHFDLDCNMDPRCPMCYRHKYVEEKEKTDYMFWLKCIPYLKKITDQVSLGGGEPLMHPEFVKAFSDCAKDENLIVNVTTNGKIPIKQEWIENITMISVSYDRYKWPQAKGLNDYVKVIRDLKDKNPNLKVGCNLLMEDWILSDYKMLIHLLIHIFGHGKADAIFALLPKKTKTKGILQHIKIYKILSYLFDDFYVDDCTRSIIINNSYENWKKPCHYASGMVSIDECRYVTGCSFSNDPLMRLEKPEDVLKIPKLEYKKRYECPYLDIVKK